jgi:hypothetical protein
MQKGLLLICSLYLGAGYAQGPCPDRVSLWKQMEFFRDSGKEISAADQLKVLLPAWQAMKNCHLDDDSTFVFLLQRIGMAYLRANEEVQAVRFLRVSVSLVLSSRIPAKIKPDQLMRSYYNLSVIYDSLRLIPERNNALDSFIILALSVHFYTPTLYHTVFERARYCFSAGDYKRCLHYCNIPELLPPSSDPRINEIGVEILTYRFNALLALKDYPTAENILSGNILTAEKEGNTRALGSFHGIAANIAMGRSDFPLALSEFHQEFNYFRMNHYAKGCAASLNAIGYFYFEKLHDLKQSLKYYRMALIYADETEAISINDNIAMLYAKKDQYDSAFFYVHNAFSRIGPGLDESLNLSGSLPQDLDNLADYVLTLVLDKGDILLQKYKWTRERTSLQLALQVYKKGDQLLNRLKSDQSEFTSRLYWRSNSHRLYEHALEAAYQDSDLPNFFYFLEKNRAVLLEDQVNERKWVTDEEILKVGQIKKNIRHLEKELEALKMDSGSHLELRSELFSNNQALTAQEESIKKQNPLYYQHFFDTSFIGIQDIQEYLSKTHQELVELYAGDSSEYAFRITPDHMALNRIAKADFDQTVNDYMHDLSDASILNEDMGGFIRTAHHLFLLIFPKGEPPDSRIMISPDGRYFPFESLVIKPTMEDSDYLIFKHPVCYTYSARYLLRTAKEVDEPGARDFMGVAPIQYASYLNLPELQGSNFSLDQIGSHFGQSDNFTSLKASKKNFLQNFSHYRLIQLYTHASGNEAGQEPIIYFADSALYLSELVPEIKPLTKLIVLSACETANGAFHSGEGVFSFNREFAALGIPSSIANLWSVDNQSTYRLTELFYKYLAAGDSTDIALQKAKKEFLGQGPRSQHLPYYWAAPVLTGNPRVLSATSRFPLNSVLLFLVLLGLLLLLYSLYRSAHAKGRKVPDSEFWVS